MPEPRQISRSIALVASVWLATAGAEPTVGTYVCSVERAVGLQGGAANAQRYGGRIELPPAERHFRFTLSRTEVGRGRRCKPAHTAELADDGYSLWWSCQATTELLFAAGKYGHSLRGDDWHIFRDRLSGWLHLADDLRYVFAYTDFAGNFFLEEGTCARD